MKQIWTEGMRKLIYAKLSDMSSLSRTANKKLQFYAIYNEKFVHKNKPKVQNLYQSGTDFGNNPIFIPN